MKKRLPRLDPALWGSAVAAWFRARLDWGPLAAILRQKTVPVHRHDWVYLLGGTSLFLFVMQIASGVLLMVYYQPAEGTAHESVHRIASEIPSGWLVRSVHAWGADLFIAAVGLHALVKLFARAYRRPRELTWVSGMLLLFAALGFGFTGYLLPWTELSYCATLVGTQIAGTVPVIGDGIVHVLRGGAQISGDTITRFYAGHVIVLPLATGALLFVKVALIQAQGLSIPCGMSPRDVRGSRPFFAEYLLLELGVWLVLFGIIVTLASLFPAELGAKADPRRAAPAGIKPEWYFLFMFQLLKHVPEWAGVSLCGLGALFFVLVPFLDRRANREEHSRWLTGLFVVLIAVAGCLQFLAWRTPSPESAVLGEDAALPSVAQVAVSLTLFWGVIGYLVYYLQKLLCENARIRSLYP